MAVKKPSVSLIIPVYNESDNLAACLRSVANQTVKPLEVLVVDNNSMDDTVAVAAEFAFVTVLHESRQGVAYARDHGFNAASGQILARIDGDTILAPDWISKIQTAFMADSSLSLLTGGITYRDVPIRGLVDQFDHFWRQYMARRLADVPPVQGANMALRRELWQQIKGDLCYKRGLHEDFDLTIHAAHYGQLARLELGAMANVCPRQIGNDFWQFYNYIMASPQTYLKHDLKIGRRIYPLIVFLVILYPLLHLMYKGYDGQLDRFSWRKALRADPQLRANPALFID